MSVLNYFEQMSIYFIVISIIYFFMDKIFQSKFLISLNIPRQLNDVIYGGLIGLINVLSEYTFYSFSKTYSIPIYFFVALILVYFKSYQTALYSILPLVIFDAIQYHISHVMYFNVAATFSIVIIVQMVKNFVKSNKEIFIATVSTISIMAIISVIFNTTIFQGLTDSEISNKLDMYILTTIGFGMNLLFFLIFSYLIKITISSNLLYKSANFEFMEYYRSGIAKSVILNFIKTNRISRGIVCVFDMKYEEQPTEEKNKEVQKSILEIISKLFTSQVVMFNAVRGTYGFFIPFSGGINQADLKIKEIIKNIPTKHKMPWGKIVDSKIKYGASLYGIQSSSITDLFKYSLFALSETEEDKSYNIFDPRIWLKHKKELYNMTYLDNSIHLDGIVNNYTNMWHIGKDITEYGYWVDQEDISEFQWYETLEEIIYFKNWQKTFYRYFANDAIKKINRTNAFIPYDLSIFENGFNIKNFINQLKRLSFNPKNLYLVIPIKSYEKVKNIDLTKEVVDKLESYGINFVVANIHDEMTRKIFENVKFSYKVPGQDEKEFLNAQIISPVAKTEGELRKFIRQGATIVGDPVLVKKNDVTKFDKQSKIYLEKIVKEERQNE